MSPNKAVRDFFFIAALIQLTYFLVLLHLNASQKIENKKATRKIAWLKNCY